MKKFVESHMNCKSGWVFVHKTGDYKGEPVERDTVLRPLYGTWGASFREAVHKASYFEDKVKMLRKNQKKELENDMQAFMQG